MNANAFKTEIEKKCLSTSQSIIISKFCIGRRKKVHFKVMTRKYPELEIF